MYLKHIHTYQKTYLLYILVYIIIEILCIIVCTKESYIAQTGIGCIHVYTLEKSIAKFI